MGRVGQMREEMLAGLLQQLVKILPLEGSMHPLMEGAEGPGVLQFALCTVYARQASLCSGEVLVVKSSAIRAEKRAVHLTVVYG